MRAQHVLKGSSRLTKARMLLPGYLGLCNI